MANDSDESKTPQELFLIFAHEVLSRIREWSLDSDLPKKPVRRFDASGFGVGVQHETDYRIMVENHIHEIITLDSSDQCVKELLKKGIIRPSEMSNTTNETETMGFEKLKPIVVRQLQAPILDLVELDGVTPSNDRIVASYEHLAQPG